MGSYSPRDNQFPDGLVVSTERITHNELDREEVLRRFELYIDKMVEMIEDSFERTEVPPMIVFPMKGSLVIYYKLMERLLANRCPYIKDIEFVFSNKTDIQRANGAEAYIENRLNKSDPYKVSFTDFPYNPNKELIIAEDISETGTSVRESVNSAIEMMQTKALPGDELPQPRVMVMAFSTKELPPEQAEERDARHKGLEIVEINDVTVYLDYLWQIGAGMDGGVTAHLDSEDVRLCFEIYERMCMMLITKPDVASIIITSMEDQWKYALLLVENNIFAGNDTYTIYNSELYKLIEAVSKIRNVDERIAFIDNYHKRWVEGVLEPMRRIENEA